MVGSRVALFCFLLCFFSSAFSCCNIAQADKIVQLSEDEIQRRRVFESNTMATTLCTFFNLLTSDITKAVLAFVLVVMGFGAYLGKINLGLIVSFVIGVGLIFAVPTIMQLLAPFSDISQGCKCKRYVVVGYNNTDGYLFGDLRLNGDCSPMT